MKYRPTVLNLASGVLIIGAIFYMMINYEKLSSGEGWGVVAMMGVIALGAVGFVLDFFIQLFTQHLSRKPRNLSRNLLGVLILVVAYYYGQYQSRSITINVPAGYDGTVALVCNVPEQPRIKWNIFTPKAELDMPASGIILTSSELRDNDIPYTDFSYPSGELIHTHGNWNNLYSDVLTYACSGQTVKYRVSNLMGPNGEQLIQATINAVEKRLEEICTQQAL